MNCRPGCGEFEVVPGFLEHSARTSPWIPACGVGPVGEGALAGVPPAIVNAVADLGIPMYELPLTPERLWRAMQKDSA